MTDDRSLRLPAAVRASLNDERPPIMSGQLWRARWGEVSRFVLVLRIEGTHVFVAPVSVEPELATDDAHLLEAGETDFGVPTAVWLRLTTPVAAQVLQQRVGHVHLPVDALPKAPQGRPLVSALEDRAMERAVLADDMAELAQVPVADKSLSELLAPVAIETMHRAGFSVPLALALRRGDRPLTPEQAELLAPLAGASVGELLAASPPLPSGLESDLDAVEGRAWVSRLADDLSVSEQEARNIVGYGAYGLAARETGTSASGWAGRIEQYVRARLSDA